VERMEVLRGGPSPIFSNGQPGATTNFILKEGTSQPHLPSRHLWHRGHLSRRWRGAGPDHREHHLYDRRLLPLFGRFPPPASTAIRVGRSPAA
jgi:hypothetical protein